MEDCLESMIQLYLKYSKSKYLTAEEFLLFRKQAIKETQAVEKQVEHHDAPCSTQQNMVQSVQKDYPQPVKKEKTPVSSTQKNSDTLAGASQKEVISDEDWISWVSSIVE